MCLKASSQYDAVLCVALICEMRNFINILVIGDQIQNPTQRNTKTESKHRVTLRQALTQRRYNAMQAYCEPTLKYALIPRCA